MFETIGDMPLHPLIIHAVVVGIPLATLLAFLFAFPRTRDLARWPLALVVVGSLAGTFVARESGEALRSALDLGSPVVELIAVHAQLAFQLLVIMAVFTVLTLVNVFVVRRRASKAGRRAVDVVLPLLLVAVAVVAAIWVFRVGDIGARAVWNPTGDPTLYSR